MHVDIDFDGTMIAVFGLRLLHLDPVLHAVLPSCWFSVSCHVL